MTNGFDAPPVSHPAPGQPGDAFDVDALIGMAPSAPAAPAPAVPTGFLAPAPVRPVQDVPVADPRGPSAEQEDGTYRPERPLTAVTGRPEIERLLVGLVAAGGSDLHLDHDNVPRYRIAGALLPVAGEQPLHGDDVGRMLHEILPPEKQERFRRTGDVDAAYAMREEDGAAMTVRFRVNVFRSMGRTGAVLRVIPTTIVPLDDLGILPQVKGLAQLPRGLVLFCGPTGSGKSTSQAGLVDEINTTRSERIFTLEDPIEFVHTSKKSMINHREVGVDTDSFLSGLKAVRRQDPDVILIGEMRDYETMGAAIEAADTGHLVIATLHTNSAPDTVSRIINSFPADRQEQIRTTLAETLKAVICQTLVPSPSSPRGRVVAQEVMMVNAAIANNIRENDIPAVRNALTDRDTGSISLDAHLAELIRQQKVTRKEAAKKAFDPAALLRQLGE